MRIIMKSENHKARARAWLKRCADGQWDEETAIAMLAGQFAQVELDARRDEHSLSLVNLKRAMDEMAKREETRS